MKKIILILLFSLISFCSFSQWSSRYRVESNTKFGWSQKTVPVKEYSDSTWFSVLFKEDIPSFANGFWGLKGNALGTNTLFIGSTDNRSVRVKTNNVDVAKIDSSGNSFFYNKLKIGGNSVASSDIFNVTGNGSISGYLNKLLFTPPATSATLTIANGKSLTQNNTLTYNGTDGSIVNFGTGGNVLYDNSGWSLSGNALGNNTSFLGSTDNRSFYEETNGIKRSKLDSTGNKYYYGNLISSPQGASSNTVGLNMGLISNGINPILGCQTTNSVGYSQIFLGANTNTTSTSLFMTSSNTSTAAGFPFFLTNTAYEETYAAHRVWALGSSGDMIWATNGENAASERIRINTSGDIMLSGSSATKQQTASAVVSIASGSSSKPSLLVNSNLRFASMQYSNTSVSDIFMSMISSDGVTIRNDNNTFGLTIRNGTGKIQMYYDTTVTNPNGQVGVNSGGFAVYGGGGSQLNMCSNGNVGCGTNFTATAIFDIKGGSTTWSPLRIRTGALVTNTANINAGNIEFLTNKFYMTTTSGVTTGRYEFAGVLTNTITLDIANTPSLTTTDNTVTVTNAAVGDAVSIGTGATQSANSCITAFVSAANTVTIRFVNSSAAAIDPASTTYKVVVIKN